MLLSFCSYLKVMFIFIKCVFLLYNWIYIQESLVSSFNRNAPSLLLHVYFCFPDRPKSFYCKIVNGIEP